MTLLELARQHYEQGAFGRALELLDRIERPTDHSILLRGVCLARIGHRDEAKSVFQGLLSKDPRSYEALTWMALLCKNRVEIEQAVRYAEQAVEVKPDDAAGYSTLGGCYLYMRRPQEAIGAFAHAAELAPDVAEHHHNLGLAYQIVRNNRAAVEQFREAIRLAPQAVQTYLVLAAHYSVFGLAGKAMEVLSQALIYSPESPELHAAIAQAYSGIRNDEAAERHFQKAMALAPDAKGAYAVWLINQGRFDEAAEIYERMLSKRQDRPLAFYGLTQAGKPIGQDLLKEMQSASSGNQLPLGVEMLVNYALGKLAEKSRDYETAMRHYDSANGAAFRVHNEGNPIDPAQWPKDRAKTSRCYERLPKLPRDAASKGAPIFIIGMIRSGTTLMEQIISSHPLVAPAGELRFWIEQSAVLAATEGEVTPERLADTANEYATYTQLIAGESDFITDKMPLNFAYAGIIHCALPDARFVHIKRNPIDTCLSIYTTYFGKGPEFAYKKSNIVAYYRHYLDTMEEIRRILPSDRLLEIEYEELIANPTSVIPAIIEFCGLPWDEACLHHERNDAPINTPSRWQARQPLYKTSTERWRKYEPWLGEFAGLLP
ncbi:MAG TPA: sulfotransferase [Fimbriimonas sp.]|nr:sulfotransferase [Fimbriimonas sp.]